MRFIPVALLCFASMALAQETKYPPDAEQIPGPPSQAETAQWRADVEHWRKEQRIRIGYDRANYLRPEFAWARRNFVQPQVMVEDRYLYDPVAGKYTVGRYLDDLDKRYGGIDSVLLWPVYPNNGIDNRNQYDLTRGLPGGVEGLKRMVADFHARNVKVFFPVMPWDQGTRDEGMPNWEATARLMAELGADGANGDTFGGFPRSFLTSADALKYPLVLEPENPFGNDELLAWNLQSWGYWKYPFVPSISRNKWLEPFHMVNVCRRWARDKTDDLQYAFFNGVGYESWENVWGIWNGINPRDAEALRRIATIERRYAEQVVSEQWEPHTPTLQYGVFASKFPANGKTLWTFVNRNEYAVEGLQIQLPIQTGMRYCDVWNGQELTPEHGAVRFAMEGHGYGALVEAPACDKLGFSGVLLASLSHEAPILKQTLVPIEPTPLAKAAPSGMVRIEGGSFDFRVSGIEIEGSNDEGVDVQYPWESSPRRRHSHRMEMKPFYMDRYPVTNQEFARFTHRAPAGPQNAPVTGVSLEEARAYAKWAGKRLPHEWEWQWAAQGATGRLYPWGNQWDSNAVPAPDTSRNMRGPDAVAAHPSGASASGVMDLTGNIWQWTDEYQDEHTRAAILRGGSYYQPQGSKWYFPQAYKLNEHGKYLLMAPEKDRSTAIGFRCVVDAMN